ncbi:hypothetical protein ACIA5C_48530 [Actinoplanes sp. NPDC051343]|uniref:hypothetical protein n=1 Tax=Actinoplanes sp. NPDC051343 TaxID=3363906 RepID=UPI00378DE480
MIALLIRVVTASRVRRHDAAVLGRDIEGGESMALQELQAMQVAYELLSPLDPSAQQRVLAWLSAALADPNGVPKAPEEPVAPVTAVADVPVDGASANDRADASTANATVAPDSKIAAPAAPVEQRGPKREPQGALEPGSKSEAAPAPALRPKRARAAKATGRRSAKTAEPPAAATPAQAAPGRRTERPTGEQFLTDLAAVGSFKALAATYGKSVGTIGNWANQLREQGFDIPVGRLKKA